MWWEILLGFQGCSNKLPETWWVKTTGICSLKVLEGRRLKSGVSWAILPPEALLGKPFLAAVILCWFRVFLGLWQHHSSFCLCLHMAFSCLSEQVLSCLLEEQWSLDLGPIWEIHDIDVRGWKRKDRWDVTIWRAYLSCHGLSQRPLCG